jgi:diacylglycerol kinase family enzyme
MPGIGLILNPKSLRNRRDKQAHARFADRLEGRGLVRTTKSFEELRETAREFHRVGIDLLAISGGDGTSHVTLSTFASVYGDSALPPVALLCAGTMNTVAHSLGVRHANPDALLKSLVDKYGRWTTVERRAMRISSDGAEGSLGFLFGTGVVQGFLREYYESGQPTPIDAVRTLARGIGSAVVGGSTIRRIAEPFRGSVTLGDGTFWNESAYLAVAAGTVAHIGFQFRPFYRCRERPDAFHALGIHASPSDFVKELPRIWRGQPMRPGRAAEALASRMVLRSAAKRIEYMVDGDLYQTDSDVVVAIGPTIRFVVD